MGCISDADGRMRSIGPLAVRLDSRRRQATRLVVVWFLIRENVAWQLGAAVEMVAAAVVAGAATTGIEPARRNWQALAKLVGGVVRDARKGGMAGLLFDPNRLIDAVPHDLRQLRRDSGAWSGGDRVVDVELLAAWLVADGRVGSRPVMRVAVACGTDRRWDSARTSSASSTVNRQSTSRPRMPTDSSRRFGKGRSVLAALVRAPAAARVVAPRAPVAAAEEGALHAARHQVVVAGVLGVDQQSSRRRHAGIVATRRSPVDGRCLDAA